MEKKVASTVVLLSFVLILLLVGCGEKQNFNANHPELRKGEVFITNADADSYRFVGWETKRAGEVSYDISGEPLGERWPFSRLRPKMRSHLAGLWPSHS